MSKQQLYYDDVQVGDALPPLIKNPTTRQLVQYAGASGDYYEIHYDHHFAVKSGLKDGVIVHGNELAGTAYVYLRSKNIVPPSTENAQRGRSGRGN